MAEPLDVGIVTGGGASGPHLEALRQVDEARLLAVCGEDAEAVKRIATEHGAQPFASLDQMLACRDLELVVVASPRSLQAEHARKALAAGKAVGLAPPFPCSMAGLDHLEAEARKARIRLVVALHARLHPGVAELRDAIARGAVGRVAMMRYALRLPAGRGAQTLAAEGIQALDLVSFLSGKRPTRLFALGREEPGRYLMMHVVLEDNVIGTAEVHIAPAGVQGLPLWEDLVVIGTEGVRRAGTGARTRLIQGTKDPLAGLVAATRGMVRHVRDGGPPPAPFVQARRVLATWLAAERSASTGQAIELAAEEAG